MKLIDCKTKEIYYNIPAVTEDKDIKRARDIFWISMNMIGIQNGVRIIKAM